MTTPALLRLREHFPDAHITLLTPEKLRGFMAGSHPAVNEIISFAPSERVFPSDENYAREISTLRWCCPIHRVRRLKSGWREFRNVSVTHARGEIFS